MGGCLPAAQFGDFLTTIFDQNAGMNGGPVSRGTQRMILTLNPPKAYSVHPAIEHRALLMLLELFDLSPDVFRGRTLTSGSTAANVLGLGTTSSILDNPRAQVICTAC
jgi:hypothetical protein